MLKINVLRQWFYGRPLWWKGPITGEYTVRIYTYRCPGAQFWHTINSHDINIYGGPDAHFYTLNCGIQLHGVCASALGKEPMAPTGRSYSSGKEKYLSPSHGSNPMFLVIQPTA
jgi:hypothetical protein